MRYCTFYSKTVIFPNYGNSKTAGYLFIKTKTVTNGEKRSSILEHLINNIDCANNYVLLRVRVVSQCINVIDLVRLEAKPVFLSKPDL